MLDSATAIGGEQTGRRRPHHLRRPGALHRPARRRRARAGGLLRDRRPLGAGPAHADLPGAGPARPGGLRRDGRARRRPGRGRPAHQDPAPPQRPARLGPRQPPTPSWPSGASSRDRPARPSGPTPRTASSPSPASRAGTFFLDYDAAYGNAPLDGSTVRVDVQPARGDRDPIAMPDTLTVYGQSAAIVDVLANDLDPAGGLLAVQRAEADDPDQLDVAIIDGRWLRDLRPPGRPVAQPAAGLLHDQQRHSLRRRGRGLGEPAPGAQGQLAGHRRRPGHGAGRHVGDRARPRQRPLARPATGSPCSATSSRARPVRLEVIAPIDVKGDVGRAFVSGRTVRYVAPAGIKERDSFQVPYVAVNTTGQTSPGRLDGHRHPGRRAQHGARAADPGVARRLRRHGQAAAARQRGRPRRRPGDDRRHHVRSAQGPAACPSAATSWSTRPTRARSAPTSSQYSVVDTQGGVATGTARVVVVPPGGAAEPAGRRRPAHRRAGAHGHVRPASPTTTSPPGDEVRIELVDPPAGVELDPGTSLVTVPAPDRVDAPAVQVVYSITNGLDSSRAVMKLETAAEINNPPVVYDAFGRADDSESVTVGVLEGAYDPDGPVDDLRRGRGARRPRRRAHRRGPDQGRPRPPRRWWSRSASRTATAPPPRPRSTCRRPGTGIPYVEPGALIELERGGDFTGRLDDFIVNPSGGADAADRQARGECLAGGPAARARRRARLHGRVRRRLPRSGRPAARGHHGHRPERQRGPAGPDRRLHRPAVDPGAGR